MPSEAEREAAARRAAYYSGAKLGVGTAPAPSVPDVPLVIKKAIHKPKRARKQGSPNLHSKVGSKQE